MQKIIILKTLFATFITVLVIASFGNCQIPDTTLSGQIILVYSDFTWELLSGGNHKETPFEAPSDNKENSELKAKQKKLISFLKKEEIYKLMSYKKAQQDAHKNIEYFYNAYSSLSNDLSTLENLSLNETNSNELIQDYLIKYFNSQPKEHEIQYIKPTVSESMPSNEVDCEILEVLDANNLITKTTPKTRLLTYTPIKLQNYYKQKNYLSVFTSISKKQHKYFINFEFAFNSKDIEKSYGNIPSDGFLRVSFINNKKIFLAIPKSVKAKIENYTGRTIYSFSCEIKEKEDVRLLKRKYISEIGLMWSSGFESYPIFDIDHFMQKIDCLDD